jgi:2-haloacid dehalogenase
MTMMANLGSQPQWLTFDCYGTLIQWDEGLVAAVQTILATKGSPGVSAQQLISVYDHYEHALEAQRPHRSFRDVAGHALRLAMRDLELAYQDGDMETLTSRISAMPPFQEVVPALAQLKKMGFKLCIISNTDDDIIAGNVAQLGGHIDAVVTAQQAQSYKPTNQIFEHVYRQLGVSAAGVVHICASPHLDLVAARDIGFRCIWIDRGTARRPLADYTPDAIFPRLDRVPVLFKQLGWQLGADEGLARRSLTIE